MLTRFAARAADMHISNSLTEPCNRATGVACMFKQG
jgi:hypothetical protein